MIITGANVRFKTRKFLEALTFKDLLASQTYFTVFLLVCKEKCYHLEMCFCVLLRPDPRSEGRLPPRSPMGPQPYNRPSSAERPRGPYRGMRAMGPRGSPSPRRGGRGYRGGHWTGDPHMRY